MRDYGTNVVAGASPKKAGTEHAGLPVTATAVDAAALTGIDVSVLFVPAQAVKSSVDDAVNAGAKLIVILTEFVPVHDTMRYVARANEAGTQMIGPNAAGVVTPGEAFVGFMPAFDGRIFQPGTIGVVSRSGSLGTLACLELTRAGLGQSALAATPCRVPAVLGHCRNSSTIQRPTASCSLARSVAPRKRTLPR